MKFIKNLLVPFALLLISTSGAYGQFLWTITHPDTDDGGRYIYSFQCLSCSGNNCTVAGILRDTTGVAEFKPNQHHVFWNSSDGGKVWQIQDPGLPVEWAVQNDPWQRVQRIDSLNIVAIGATGLIMRSFDAGNSWVYQTVETKQGLTGVHFSDSLTGIITAYPDGKITSVFTTSDGGRNWNSIPFKSINYPWSYSAATFLWQCHSYGNGKFRIFQNGIGPVYTTTDNWNTVTNSNLLIDSTKDDSWNQYYFADCTFSDSSEDILTYGIAAQGNLCAVMYSGDAGNSWTNLYTHNEPRSLVHSTQIDKDTILVSGYSNNHILRTIDRGHTWLLDTIAEGIMPFDGLEPIRSSGLQWVSDGAVVAIIASSSSSDFLLRGEVIHSGVNININSIHTNGIIYPNPASTGINILSEIASEQVYIYDIFGHEIMKGESTSEGKATFDISMLPYGVYHIIINHQGRMLPIGKVAVIGK